MQRRAVDTDELCWEVEGQNARCVFHTAGQHGGKYGWTNCHQLTILVLQAFLYMVVVYR